MDSAVVAKITEKTANELKPYRAIVAALPPVMECDEWSISIAIPTGESDPDHGEQSRTLLWPIPKADLLSLDDDEGLDRVVRLLVRSAIVSLMVPEAVWGI